MNALFEMPIDDEILSSEELAQITGCARKTDQIDWLCGNDWTYHKNKAGEPIVGRLYTRLRLAGINPKALTSPGSWVADFSGIR